MSKKICGIYEILNIINGNKYIGSSINIYKRWREHKYYFKHNKHSKYIQRVWNKYGENIFKFRIIRECKEENLLKIEQFYIDRYWNLKILYNLSKKAGKVDWNEERRKKQSKLKKGILFSKEHKKNLSIALTGKKIPKEVIEKIVNTKRLKGYTKQQIEKRKKDSSKANKGRIYIKKEGKTKFIKKEELQKYIKDKWEFGRYYSRKNKHLSDETKKKISTANKGRRLTKTHKLNLSKSKKGCIPWNKGLNKEIDIRVRKNGENIKKVFEDKNRRVV